jgi:hypothetical protein
MQRKNPDEERLTEDEIARRMLDLAVYRVARIQRR